MFSLGPFGKKSKDPATPAGGPAPAGKDDFEARLLAAEAKLDDALLQLRSVRTVLSELGSAYRKVLDENKSLRTGRSAEPQRQSDAASRGSGWQPSAPQQHQMYPTGQGVYTTGQGSNSTTVGYGGYSATSRPSSYTGAPSPTYNGHSYNHYGHRAPAAPAAPAPLPPGFGPADHLPPAANATTSSPSDSLAAIAAVVAAPVVAAVSAQAAGPAAAEASSTSRSVPKDYSSSPSTTPGDVQLAVGSNAAASASSFPPAAASAGSGDGARRSAALVAVNRIGSDKAGSSARAVEAAGVRDPSSPLNVYLECRTSNIDPSAIATLQAQITARLPYVQFAGAPPHEGPDSPNAVCFYAIRRDDGRVLVHEHHPPERLLRQFRHVCIVLFHNSPVYQSVGWDLADLPSGLDLAWPSRAEKCLFELNFSPGITANDHVIVPTELYLDPATAPQCAEHNRIEVERVISTLRKCAAM